MLSDDTERGVIALLGISAVMKLLPLSQELALIMNGTTTYEQGVEEGKNPHTKKVVDEFIHIAQDMTKEELIGALFYAMPDFARAQAMLEDEDD